MELNKDYVNKLRDTSVHNKSPGAGAQPDAPLVVDIKTPDQYGLRSPEQIQELREAIVPGSVTIVDPKVL